MATDVDVQFFSHLNGLVLGNNWGDMIRLLDTCLVNGLPLPSVTSASIDAQGDITLNLYADHKSLLFQIVELSGFEPVEINGKYRIKGTPTATKLILKATHVGKTVTKIGTAKLASLGYDIAFRDSADVKRAYRSKNPRTEHPFIRVDETISDGTNSYTSTYAKSAMVGLIENMTHIDDYQDTSKLQLPLDTTDFSKNWKINGTGTSVVRGWCKWYWAANFGTNTSSQESSSPSAGNRNFTITGSGDAFYFMIPARQANLNTKVTYGCGLFDSATEPNAENPPWFLMAELDATTAAGVSRSLNYNALMVGSSQSRFLVTPQSLIGDKKHTHANPILVNYQSGIANLTPLSDMPTISVPFYDEQGALRGSLKHIHTILKYLATSTETKPISSENSMFVVDTVGVSSVAYGYLGYYLGDLE